MQSIVLKTLIIITKIHSYQYKYKHTYQPIPFTMSIQTKRKTPLRENRTLTFNPETYDRYKSFIESKDKIMCRDLERYMQRQLDNYA